MAQILERITAVEVTLEGQDEVLREIKGDVKTLIADKLTRDAEKRTLRKMAAYVSAGTSAAITFVVTLVEWHFRNKS